MSHGIDINGSDNKMNTALHWAAFLACENAVSFLTAWGASLNLQESENGYTPLHIAIVAGSVRIVRKLLIKGADTKIRDKLGRLPIDHANECGISKIIHMLVCVNVRNY
jgi:ankyrin repeat protein